MDDCKWLPECYAYPDWNNYKEYANNLYNYFQMEYIDKGMSFRGKPIRFRRGKIEDGKEEFFFHLTCKNYTQEEERDPDPERIVRLPWLRALLDNYSCQEDCCDEKPRVWKECKKGVKYYIYFNRYLVILQERQNYFLLITAFYVDTEPYHRDLLRNSERPENAV